MDTIIDALELTGFAYNRIETLLTDRVSVFGWASGSGSLDLSEDIATGEIMVTESWAGHAVTDHFAPETVVSWITSQARL